MIKCTGDTNALENAFIKNQDGDIKDMVDVAEDIKKIEYDLDAAIREVKDLREDIDKLKKTEKEDYDFTFREITGTDNNVNNLDCRISDLEGIMFSVIKRLDVLLPDRKIDLEDYQYYRDAIHYDDE